MERTQYMQQLMTSTYPQVAIEAITGGFDGSWQRLIVKRLRQDYAKGKSEAECIVQAAGGLSDQKLMQAADMILNSKIPAHENYKH